MLLAENVGKQLRFTADQQSTILNHFIEAGLHKPHGQTIADKTLFMIAAMAAEMECNLIRERTLDGPAAAQARAAEADGPRPSTTTPWPSPSPCGPAASGHYRR
jgi:DNA invertase Pin-like site-specific DNA recombinase